MTYCLAIKVKEGLLALADTRITAGTEISAKKKILVVQKENFSLFLMTSGLRSVRDKAVIYFKELLEGGAEYTKLYQAVNAFGEQVRRVAHEDRAALEKAGFRFNLNTIVGGQLRDDEEHQLFLLYPEGNWVELDKSAPFVIIGNAGHGKAILNRTLHPYTTLKQAFKVGFLSFDSTRVSANDVDFPIDVVLYKANSFTTVEQRYEKQDLETISALWAEELQNALSRIPEEWMDRTLNRLP